MSLLSMFPELEPAVIATVLRAENGNSIATIDKLLELAADIDKEKADESESEEESAEEEESEEEIDELEPLERADVSPFDEIPEDDEVRNDVEAFEMEDYNDPEEDRESFKSEDRYDEADLEPVDNIGYAVDEDEAEENDYQDGNYHDEEEEEPNEEESEPYEELHGESEQDETDQEEHYNDDFESESEGEVHKDEEEEEEEEEAEQSEDSPFNDISPVQATPNHEPETWSPGPSDQAELGSRWYWAKSRWDEVEKRQREERELYDRLEKREELLKKEKKKEAKMAAALQAAAEMEFMRLRIKELEETVVRVEEEKKRGMTWVLQQITEIKKDNQLKTAELAAKDETITELGAQLQIRDEELERSTAEIERLTADLQRNHAMNALNWEAVYQTSRDAISVGAQSLHKNVMDGVAKLEGQEIVDKIREMVTTLREEVTDVLSKPLHTAKEIYNGHHNEPEEQRVAQAADQEQDEELEKALKASMETFNEELRERALRHASVQG